MVRITASSIFICLVGIFQSTATVAGSQFVKVDSLAPPERSRLQSLVDSSFHFRLDSGVDCTGTFISNAGHFLTARHCIAGCLIHNQAISKELAIDEPTGQITVGRNSSGELLVRNRHTYKMTIEDERIDDGVDCPGVINNKRANIRILMTGGRGWLTPSTTLATFSKQFPSEYQELLDEGYEHRGDFAVLQAVGFKPSNCLNLAAASPRNGQPLNAVSYPCLSRGTLSTDGKTALFTRGTKTTGFEQSDFFKARGTENIPFNVQSVERKETFFSTLDMEKCGSGTALVDSDLNIVGIATRVYKSSTRYESGSLEAIDIVQIWKDLRDKRAPDLREITTCLREPSVSWKNAKVSDNPKPPSLTHQ